MNKHAEIYEYELCTSFYNTPFILMSRVQELMVVPVSFVFVVSCCPSGTYNLEVGDVSDYKVYAYIVKHNYVLGGMLFTICKAQLHVSATTFVAETCSCALRIVNNIPPNT